MWVIPDERLVMRLRIDGRKLVASFVGGRRHAWERVSNSRSAVRANSCNNYQGITSGHTRSLPGSHATHCCALCLCTGSEHLNLELEWNDLGHSTGHSTSLSARNRLSTNPKQPSATLA